MGRLFQGWSGKRVQLRVTSETGQLGVNPSLGRPSAVSTSKIPSCLRYGCLEILSRFPFSFLCQVLLKELNEREALVNLTLGTSFHCQVRLIETKTSKKSERMWSEALE